MSFVKSNIIKLKGDVTPLSVPAIDKSTITSEKKKSDLPKIDYEKRKIEKLTRDKIIKILNSDKMISSKKCPQDVTMEMLVDVMGNKSDVKYYVENNNKDALWEVYYNFLVDYVIM